jgi:hypothetical protein
MWIVYFYFMVVCGGNKKMCLCGDCVVVSRDY